MRHIQKDLQNIPANLKDETAIASLKLVAAGNKDAIKRAIYRGENNQQEVVLALKKLYYDKCAYCETKEFNPQIEHYRPLRKVIHTSPVHQGYYWLCYEWTNLLPACHSCNTVGGGKGSKFPIISKKNRQYAPIFNDHKQLNLTANQAHLSPLIDEKPYLLHPEIDEPINFFRFNNKGKMFGVDEQNRGQQTIDICNLNRGNLIHNRQQIINQLVDNIESSLFLFYELKKANEKHGDGNAKTNAQNNLKLNLKRIFDKLNDRTQIRHPYSLFSLYLFNNFETMILPLLKYKKHKNLLKIAFRNYLQQRL